MSTAEERIREIIEDYFDVVLDPYLQDMLETRSLSGNEWLFRQGDASDSLYLLVRGRLQVWVKAEDAAKDDPSVLLGYVVSGESVGEAGLLSGEPRTASIRASRDSLLIVLRRDKFELLTQRYPTLVMKLAGNVVKLLQRRTSFIPATSRGLSTIAVLRLDQSPRSSEFCTELSEALETHGPTLHLSQDNLGGHGAPIPALHGDESIPGSLSHWLYDQETKHRFIVFSCDESTTSWTKFAVRQSDIVVYVVDAQGDPNPARWKMKLRSLDGASMVRQMLVLLQPPSSTPISNTKAWLSERRLDYHVHVRADQPGDVSRVARIVSGNAIGLVLSGGAARGIAHLGVYKALEELGIPIDWVGGVSMGSMIGGGIACEWGAEKGIRVARATFISANPFRDYTLPLMSLISGRGMDHNLTRYFGQNIEDLPIPYFCISCELSSGNLNVHESGPLDAAIRASSSMPGIFPPVVVKRRLAVDGGVINNLPVDIMWQKPVGKVIAVDLSSQKNYEVAYTTMPSPWAVLRGRLLPFATRYRVPNLFTTLLQATNIGAMKQLREQGRGADLLLRPPVGKFGVTQLNAFDQILDVGYEHTRQEVAAWLERTEQSRS